MTKSLSRVVVLQLDLHRGEAVRPCRECAELFERHVDEALVVLAHLGLEVVGDEERAPHRLEVAAADGGDATSSPGFSTASSTTCPCSLRKRKWASV